MYCLFGKRRGKNAVFVVCGLQACAFRRIFDVGAGFRRARNGRENYFFALRKKGKKKADKKKALVRGLVKIRFIRKKESVV